MQRDDIYHHSRIIVDQLQNKLRQRADPTYAEWYRHNVKPTAPVRGVRMQDLRHLVMAWHQEWQAQQNPPTSSDLQLEVTFLLFHAEHVDDRLAAMVYLDEVLIPNSIVTPNLIPRLSTLFPPALISDFKACDHFAAKVLQPLLIRYGSQVSDHLRTWFTAESVWQARAALSALTPLASDAIHDDLLFSGCKIVLERPEEEAKSIVGSALRALGKVRPELVESFLSDHNNLMNTNAACLNKATQFLEGRRQTHFREQRRLLLAWNSQLSTGASSTMTQTPQQHTQHHHRERYNQHHQSTQTQVLQAPQPISTGARSQVHEVTSQLARRTQEIYRAQIVNYPQQVPMYSDENVPQPHLAHSELPQVQQLTSFRTSSDGLTLPQLSGSMIEPFTSTETTSGAPTRNIEYSTNAEQETIRGGLYPPLNQERYSTGLPSTPSSEIRYVHSQALPIFESRNELGIVQNPSSTGLHPMASIIEPLILPTGPAAPLGEEIRPNTPLTGVAHGRISRTDSGSTRRRTRRQRSRSGSSTPSSVLSPSGLPPLENDPRLGVSGVEGGQVDSRNRDNVNEYIHPNPRVQHQNNNRNVEDEEQ